MTGVCRVLLCFLEHTHGLLTTVICLFGSDIECWQPARFYYYSFVVHQLTQGCQSVVQDASASRNSDYTTNFSLLALIKLVSFWI